MLAETKLKLPNFVLYQTLNFTLHLQERLQQN